MWISAYFLISFLFMIQVSCVMDLVVKLNIDTMPMWFSKGRIQLCVTEKETVNATRFYEECELGASLWNYLSEFQFEYNIRVFLSKNWKSKGHFHMRIQYDNAKDFTLSRNLTGYDTNQVLKLNTLKHCGNKFIRFELIATLACAENYYNSNCSMRCDPPLEGMYYTCNQLTGMRECTDGYIGTNCNYEKCDACVGGTCMNDGSCLCFGSWYGKKCEFCDEIPYCRDGFCTDTQCNMLQYQRTRQINETDILFVSSNNTVISVFNETELIVESKNETTLLEDILTMP